MLNKLIVKILPLMPEKLVWQFSKRYVAGSTLGDAIRVSRELNKKGAKVTIDLLGEFITDLGQANENKTTYLNILNAIERNHIDGNVSIKPTFFGLLLDEKTAHDNIAEVVHAANEIGNFVRIDMEDSECTDREIALYKSLFEKYPNAVGLVLQAYLRRTANDITQLAQLNAKGGKVNFRICKGIYIEPEAIAFKGYQEVRDEYLHDLELMLDNGIYAAIATHDKYLIEKAMDMIKSKKTDPSMYEFQMLYGVTPALRDFILAQGHTMRIYVPYGQQWFGYCNRRMKENPGIVTDVMKALFVRN